MSRKNTSYALRCIALTTFLSFAFNTTHAEDTRRCEIKGKTVITNMTCERLANEAGVSLPASDKTIRQERIERTSVESGNAPFQAQPNGATAAPALRASPTRMVLNSVLPLIVSFGLIALLVAWLKIRAKRALYRRLSSLAPIARDALEPILKKTKPVADEVLPYRQAPVMSRYELELFDRLKTALPECEIFPQVPLASFIRIDKQRAGGKYRSNSYRWQNRISQQRVDFLACLRQDMSILSAIELDDPSHDDADAMRRDEKKNKSLQDANISLIRWRVEAMPDSQAIRQAFVQRGLISSPYPALRPE